MDAANLVWSREQEVLATAKAYDDAAFAADFVSFDPQGNQLTGEQFASQMHSTGLLAEKARLMWCEQGQQDSYCIAFRVPETNGQMTTHLSLWRMIDKEWRKQFHIFVEGEDSLEKSQSIT